MNKQISTGTRLSSMFLDNMISAVIVIIFSLPLIVIQNNISGPVHSAISSGSTIGVFFYLSLFGFSIYPCKDSLNGQSIAKRNFKLMVIDNQTEEPASPFQCFLRNIFCVIWPIEVIITFINVDRRIGDFVAGTRIVHVTKEVNKKINYLKVVIVLSISYLVFIIIFKNYTQFLTDMFIPTHKGKI